MTRFWAVELGGFCLGWAIAILLFAGVNFGVLKSVATYALGLCFVIYAVAERAKLHAFYAGVVASFSIKGMPPIKAESTTVHRPNACDDLPTE